MKCIFFACRYLRLKGKNREGQKSWGKWHCKVEENLFFFIYKLKECDRERPAVIYFCTHFSSLALSACDSSNSMVDVNGTKFLDGKASIVLPEGYKRMPDEMLAVKYDKAQWPKEVWCVESEGGKVTRPSAYLPVR